MNSRSNILSGSLLWPAISLLLLLGIVAEAQTRIRPENADRYMQDCRTWLEQVPMRIGNWTGTDIKQPDSAIQLLRPNEIISRRYTNVVLGEQLDLLIVHCRDAGDLQGHYPMNCYPAQGYKLVREGGDQARTWTVAGTTISGREYLFETPPSEGRVVGDLQCVYNFFVLPHVPGRLVSHRELDGVFWPDIDGVYKSGQDYQRRYFGAAEFQVLMSGQLSRQQRDQAFEQILAPVLPAIQVLLNRPAADKAPDAIEKQRTQP